MRTIEGQSFIRSVVTTVMAGLAIVTSGGLQACAGCDDTSIEGEISDVPITGLDARDGSGDGSSGGETSADVADAQPDTDGSTADSGDGQDGDTNPANPSLKCTLRTAAGFTAFGPPTALSLTAADEPTNYAASPGLQFDLRMETSRVAAGAEVKLTITPPNGAPASNSATVAATGDTSGRADLTNVTLQVGASTLTVETTAADGSKLTCEPTVVTVVAESCAATIAPVAPGCVTADADAVAAGVQAAFLVTRTAGSCTDVALEVTDAQGVTKTTAKSALAGNGTATVLATVSSAASVDGVTAQVTALLSSTAGAAAGKSATLAIQVDTQVPAVTLDSPVAASLGLADDADGNAGDGKLTLTFGGTSGAAGPIQLLSNGVALASTTAGGATAPYTWSAQGVFTVDGVYAIEARATDACGNAGTATKSYTIAVSKAALAITTPAAGASLLAKNDGTPSTALVYETAFTVTASKLAFPATLTVKCQVQGAGNPFVTVGSATFAAQSAGDLYIVPVAIDVSVVGQKVACFVEDAGTNPAQSALSALGVGLPAPAMTLIAPLVGAVAAATQLTVSGTTQNLDAVIPTLSVTTPTATISSLAAPSGVVGGGFTYTMHLTTDGTATGATLADGVYTIGVSATDAFGNAVAAVRDIRLDRTAPVLTIYAPAKATLNPIDDPDSNATLAGYQTGVGVAVNDGGQEVGSEVCLSTNGAQPLCQKVAAGTTVTFADVTLQPGQNTLAVTGKDAAGNAATATQASPVLVSDAPAVFITKPASDTVTAATTVDLTVKVQDKNAQPITTATVTLTQDAVAVAAAPTNNGDGTYDFKGVTLSGPGAHAFVASAVFAALSGTSSPRVVTQKVTQPTIAFDSPKDGDALNRTSPLCAPGKLDCELSVTCATQNVENGSVATLSGSCGGGAVTGSGLVTADQVVFAGVVLNNNAKCTLTCEVTDQVGVKASAVATVSVDRTAPKITVFNKPANTALIATDDEDKSASGLQYSPQVTVCGVEQGQLVTITLTPDGGAATSITAPVDQTLADNQCAIIAFSLSPVPQGVVTFKATVSDKAGNAATPLAKAVQVVSDQAYVRISAPGFIPPTTCTTDAECQAPGLCHLGLCTRPWGQSDVRKLNVIALGFPSLTGNLRVCTTSPLYATKTACQTAGYHEAADPVTLINPPAPKELDVTAVSDDAHDFIVELKLTEAGQWTSSLDAVDAKDRSRLVWIDTVPAVVGLPVCVNDTQAPAGTWNAAEVAGGLTLTATSSKPGTATIKVDGSVKKSTAVAAGSVSFVFAAAEVAATFGEGPHSVTVTVVDAVGNTSTSAPLDVTVDVSKPTLAFSAPSSSPLLAGASRDIALLSDAVGQTVTLIDKGLTVASTPVAADGTASFPFGTFAVLTDGTHVLTASVTDPAGNTTFAPQMQVLVDTVPPTASLTAPVDGASLVDSDDASAQGGFQINVAALFGGDTATWEVRLSTNCSAAFAACDAPSTVMSGSALDGLNPAQTITLPILKTPDYLIVSAVAKDAAGNTTTVNAKLTVTLSNCQAALTGLPSSGLMGNALCPTAGSDCASVTLPVTIQLVGACGLALTMQLYKNGIASGSAVIVNGSATFNVTFTHGTATALEGRAITAASALVASTGEKTWTADLHDPVIAFSAKQFTGDNGAFTSPATGQTVSFTAKSDLSTATPGLQVALRVDVTEDQPEGEFTSLFLTRPNSTIGPITGTSPTIPIFIDQFTGDVTNVTLEDGVGIVVTALATDKVGNSAQTTFTYSSDVGVPGALALTVATVSPRRPAVNLSWKAVGDNGTTGAPATSYDIRYSRTPISEGTFTTACKANALIGAAALPTPAAPGTDQTYAVTGPDPRGPSYQENGQSCHFVLRTDGGTWYFAARALDAAGNAGPIGTASTTELKLNAAKVSVVGAGFTAAVNTQFDRRISSIGDVNNDTFADFVVGGNQTNGFCVIYGSKQNTVPNLTIADAKTAALATDPWQCFMDATSTRAGSPAKSIGDWNGDGLQDFAVSAEIPGAPVLRQIRIYFGVNGGRLASTASVSIVGFNDTQPSKVFAGGGNFNGDVNGLNPLDDLLVGSRLESPNKVYLVPGHASVSSLPLVGGIPTLDLASATARAGFGVVTFQMKTVATGGPDFGSQVEFAGNALTDTGSPQFDEVAISGSEPTGGSQVVVIKGRALTLTQETILEYSFLHDQSANALFDDAKSVQLVPVPFSKETFGDQIVGGRDFDGDGTPDLLVGHGKNGSTIVPNNPSLYIFSGTAIQAHLGSSLQMTLAAQPVGDGAFPNAEGLATSGTYGGFDAAINVDDDLGSAAQDSIDVLFLKYPPTDSATGGAAYIRLNTHNPNATPTALPYGTFPYVDLQLVDPFAVNAKFGNFAIRGIGDFNGDGLEDFVVGTNGSGYSVLFY